MLHRYNVHTFLAIFRATKRMPIAHCEQLATIFKRMIQLNWIFFCIYTLRNCTMCFTEMKQKEVNGENKFWKYKHNTHSLTLRLIFRIGLVSEHWNFVQTSKSKERRRNGRWGWGSSTGERGTKWKTQSNAHVVGTTRRERAAEKWDWYWNALANIRQCE